MNYRDFFDQQIKTNPKFKEEYLKSDLRFDVSQLIAQARYHKNLSQEKLAELVGTKQPSIARMESGKTLPSLSFLEKIAEALGTHLVAPKFGFMQESLVTSKTVEMHSVDSQKELISPSPYFVVSNTSLPSHNKTIISN